MPARSVRFLVNVRPLTTDPVFRQRLRPQGFLVPPDYLTAQTRAFVSARSRGGVPLLVDNGKFDEVGRIAALLGPDAATIAGNASGAVLARELMRRVEDASADSAGLPLEEQLALGATGVVGAENVTAAVWLRLGLDGFADETARRRLGVLNTRVAKTAAQEVASHDDLRTGRVTYLPVASAFDHDSAVAAGRAFAREGFAGVAMGFGAYMADDRYTDTERINGRFVRLPVPMPRRYLRTQLVALGLWKGWRQETGSSPSHVHFLGLGAPIMLGLVSLAAQGTPTLSFDATSPIKDAVDGTLYLDDPAPLKVRTRRTVERMLDDPTYRWSCRCPFCTSFTTTHPLDLDTARAWRQRNPRRAITASDLTATATLGGALLLFSEPKSGPLRKDVDHARIGHNHWVLQRMCRGIGSASDRGVLPELVTQQIDQYAATANSSRYVQAVRAARAWAMAAQMVNPI